MTKLTRDLCALFWPEILIFDGWSRLIRSPMTSKCFCMKPVLFFFVFGSTAVLAIDFKKDIRPIFKENCYECHSKESGKEKAGYIFDDVETLKLDIQPKGIIVPKMPEESYLLEVMTMDVSEKAHMPPKEAMSARDIAKIREWIAAGALMEGEGAATLPVRAAVPAGPLDWTNTEGKTIKAGFVRLDGENVVLKMPANGQEIPYPLAKLNAASQAQAKAVAEGK